MIIKIKKKKKKKKKNFEIILEKSNQNKSK
jgi:hypothetical protein